MNGKILDEKMLKRKTGYPDMQIVNIAHPEAPKVLRVLSHKAEPEDILMASEYFRQMPVEEQLKSRIVMELSYRINGDQRGGNGMGGFFEAYVDPLQEAIKQKDAELEQKDVELEKKVVEMEQNKINNIKLLMKNLKCSLEEALNALEIKGKERTIIVNKLQK